MPHLVAKKVCRCGLAWLRILLDTREVDTCSMGKEAENLASSCRERLRTRYYILLKDANA